MDITEVDVTTGVQKTRNYTVNEISDNDAAIVAELDAVNARPYSEKRSAEYPDIGDQLDAIWKELKKQKSDGVVLELETDTMLLNIESVKTKYPKV